MKLHRLELTGFGPFRETQTVDFDAFDADGVFLITGRTGAGKSSILDGVSFALYGTVPRYEGGERRLRSDHSFLGDPTEVRLEFTVGDRRWRVTRAPEYDRPAKRGGGLTTEPTRAELEERVGGEWVGRAAKPREVGILLDEEIGLNAQQFQQVILLAQNKFSRFLLAGNDERRALLRTLFGTRRFETYTADLEQRRRDAQKSRESGDAHLRTLLELAERVVEAHDLAGDDERPADVAGRRDAAERALRRGEYRHDVAATARRAAEAAVKDAATALAVATAHAAALAELEAARADLSRLEGDLPRVRDDRTRLDRALEAETLRAPLDVVDRAATARAEAAELAAEAETVWRAGGGADDPSAEVERLTGELAVWAAAEPRERALHDAEHTLRAETDALRDLTETLAAAQAEAAGLPARLAALDVDIADLSVDAGRRDDLTARLAELDELIRARTESTALADALHDAEEHYLRSSADAAAAAADVTALLQRRLAGYAGELAAALVAGESCAVCGAVEHPHPAVSTLEPVTPDDIAAAEERRDLTAGRALAAGDRARAARDAHAAAAVRAGSRPLADLEAEALVCRAEVRVAQDAGERAAALSSERAVVEGRAAALENECAGLVARRERVALAHAATERTVADLRSELAAARGEFATVADRIAAATARRDEARVAVTAQHTLAERTRALDGALADRDARIAASGFADADEARRCLLPVAERAALEQRIAEHAAELAAMRSRLLNLELETVEAPPADLDATQQAASAADAAHAAAIEAERDARNTVVRLRELLVDADAAAAGNAALAADADAVTRLADTVAGRAPNTMKMELETFVLAAELEEIVAAANLRLSDMSAGRYSLHHSDARAARGRASGLAIEVLDAYTGRLRSPQSLSGGETFLASLALALGLAEVVTSRAGGVRLDTLFVDEGFGSLDPETLESAMRTLDELRAGGRTVGVISHVEAMKEQLPAQVTVEAVGQGPSVIRQDAARPR